MASERAHPDAPGFQAGLRLRWRRGVVPWLEYVPKSPYRKAFEWRYRWVARQTRHQDVLDIPCGMGWGTSMLRACRTRIGVDLSVEAIGEATRRYGRVARFLVGDMARLPFADRSFDAVICLEGIEHVPLDTGRRFLTEAWRVLRDDGQLFLSSPHCRHGRHSGNPFHIHEYSPDELRSLVESRFTIEETIERHVDVMIVHYLRARKRPIAE